MANQSLQQQKQQAATLEDFIKILGFNKDEEWIGRLVIDEFKKRDAQFFDRIFDYVTNQKFVDVDDIRALMRAYGNLCDYESQKKRSK